MRQSKRLAPAFAMLLALGAGCSERDGAERGGEARPAAAFALSGRVDDRALILDAAAEARLAARLARLEQATRHQMVAVTVPSLGGRDVADYTRDLANARGIGRRGHNDGVVILVAPNERRARIEIGTGLEAVLSNALCAQIMRDEMIPRFRSADYAGGIEAGVEALARRLEARARGS
jgi:uncharacterized protein